MTMGHSLFDAWTDALPRVLALLPDGRQGLFRQELQRFLAMSRFAGPSLTEVAGPVRELLLTSLRAASAPAAIHETRAMGTDPKTLVALCEHLLAIWRDAEAGAAAIGSTPEPSCAPASSEVFFGPRLGGPGRPGALRREAE